MAGVHQDENTTDIGSSEPKEATNAQDPAEFGPNEFAEAGTSVRVSDRRQIQILVPDDMDIFPPGTLINSVGESTPADACGKLSQATRLLVSSPHQDELRALGRQANELHERIYREASHGVMELGRLLLKARDLAGSQKVFPAFAAECLHFKKSSAYGYLRAAEEFATAPHVLEHLPIRDIFKLTTRSAASARERMLSQPHKAWMPDKVKNLLDETREAGASKLNSVDQLDTADVAADKVDSSSGEAAVSPTEAASDATILLNMNIGSAASKLSNVAKILVRAKPTKIDAIVAHLQANGVEPLVEALRHAQAQAR